MRTVVLLSLLMLLLAPARADELPGGSGHLQWIWNDDAMDAAARHIVERQGEATCDKVLALLGTASPGRIVVLMNGPSEKPDGSRGIPHVDREGRVHLYRFGPTHHDYLSAFAHELVHALRIGRMPHHDWFFEEGFAEFVALRVNDERRGFPWYGFPVDVVAGQWVVDDADLPLALVRERHAAINLPCKLQVYALRGSFFHDLGHRFGDAAILALAGRERAGALEDYASMLGVDFDNLVASWREGLRGRYLAIEDAADQARRYRTESPARYQSLCAPDGTVKR